MLLSHGFKVQLLKLSCVTRNNEPNTLIHIKNIKIITYFRI